MAKANSYLLQSVETQNSCLKELIEQARHSVFKVPLFIEEKNRSWNKN